MRHKIKILSLYNSRPVKAFSDTLLVQKAKRGDKEAFGSLYHKHLDSIYRYIFFRVNQDAPQAEDLTEMVFFKAWEKLEDFDGKSGGFRAWIYRIAHNIVIDHYRTHKRHASLTEATADESQNVEERVLQVLEYQGLMKALKELPSEQRDVVTMKFIEGLSNKEICKILDRKEDAVRALQYRALKNLRKILKKYE